MTKEIDAAIELQLDIARVSASAQADAVKILRKMERDLVAEVSTSNYTNWRKARVEKQLREVRAAISDYYVRVSDSAAETGAVVADVVARSTVVSMGAAATMPSAARLASIASDILILGAPQSAWWAKQSADTAFKFGQAVRQGMVASETNQQIVRRVLDFMDVSKANAAALVQTGTASVANDARMAVFAANESVIEVYRALATLDSHTCMVCAPLDGLEWEKDGTPIGHNFDQPVYPLHYNCRCIMLGRVTREDPGGKRAAAGGPVSAKTTFADWLERQPLAKQAEVLGKGRAELFKAGKITLNDLTNGRGNPLTLEQLKAKYA